MAPTMPWKIEYHPVRSGTAAFKVYPGKLTFPASEDEVRVWEYVTFLREQLLAVQNQLNTLGRKKPNLSDPTLPNGRLTSPPS